MCGIIGYIGKSNAVTVILDGLKRLEYRGYDSAGIAFFTDNNRIAVRRCKGKINDLYPMLMQQIPQTHTAIGHTRWATHGRPSEENAHPHRSNGIVLVHNGIIENYLQLKKELEKEGYNFTSETDTEVMCHLIHKYSSSYDIPLEEAVRRAMKDIRGAYAIAVMSEKEPGKIVGVRRDSPLVVGLGDGEFFVASDIPAFLSYSRDVIFLNDDEMVVMTDSGITISTLDGTTLQKDVMSISWNSSMAEKGGYRHFMLKEIFEQPRAIADTITGRLHPETGEINLEEFHLTPDYLKDIKKIFIVACGTSWHAAMVGKYMIEELARVPVEVDIASEFRYRNPLLGSKTLFIAITQSGETADTLAAQRHAKQLGTKVMSICNVIGSTASREADAVFYTRSGPEIGVASTKAFTTQLVGLFLFAIALGRINNVVSKEQAKKLLSELLMIPDKVETVLSNDSEIEKIAKESFKKDSSLYLGRGINYPIAMEGALKLKEISYIHAEAYPAGEMKHGPIALVEEDFPVLFLAPKDRLYEKVISNIQEIRSRSGKIIAVTTEGNTNITDFSDYSIYVPEADPLVLPILLVVPLQLIAYHIGVLRGCDVDQPRNLAKSVTVE
jgi:glucosamine--fructose-6-phosphate aminotransferase (isomerizing)